MTEQKTYLVLGATGRTGRHFTSIALDDGQRVRALVRNPAVLERRDPELEVRQGFVTEDVDLDRLLTGVDAVVSLLGDARAQRSTKMNTALVRRLVPAMRRQGVLRLLYQAGGLSAAPGRPLSPLLKVVRSTTARRYIGQHEDNEAVMRYLCAEADDIEWMVHRAGIGSDGPSKGVLQRSGRKISVATFRDCAAYDYQLLSDPSAIHNCDGSAYRSRRTTK